MVTDSALRRPLLWLLAAYMAALAALHARGAFVPPAAPELAERYARGAAARVEALADEPAREDQRGWKSSARALSLDGAAFDGRVQVRWPRGAELEALPLPGDRVVVSGRLRRPRAPKNPGDFDEASFLADRGVAWVLEAKSFAILLTSRPDPRIKALRGAERLRRSVHARLMALLPPERARLLEGLMLGYKGALPLPLARATRDAGLIHLIVPSGAKVALALAAAALLAGALRLSPAARWLLAAAAGGVVTLAAGAEPPYWRAYLAALILGGFRARGREGDAFQALVLSAWLLLLAAPRLLFSAGFVMSYLALAGILALWPLLLELAPPRWPRAARAAVVGLGVSAAVQAALWPVFAADFGRASVIGVAANAVAVPAYPALASAGWGLWGASFTGGPPARALALALSWALVVFAGFCERAAALPGAAVALSPWPAASVAAYYLALAALPRLRRRSGLLMMAAAGGLWAGGRVWRRAQEPPLRVIFLKAPPRAGRARTAALVVFAGGGARLVGEAPPSLVRRAAAALALGPLERPWPLPQPGAPPLRLGSAVVDLARRRVRLAGNESAILGFLKSSAVEVATDGVEVHVGFPR